MDLLENWRERNAFKNIDPVHSTLNKNIFFLKGAVPATIAIKNGKVKVGLTESEINELGDTNASKPLKTSRRDFAYVVSNKKNGGTTVSGTLIVANLANIPIFATGGKNNYDDNIENYDT